MVVIYKCNLVIIDSLRYTLWNLFYLNNSLATNDSQYQWCFTFFWTLNCYIFYQQMLPRCWRIVGKAPQLEIVTSTFASDWQKALEQPQHADVVFVAEGQHSFKAHKVVLCSASRFFRQVLNPDLNLDLTSQVQTGMYKLIAFNCDRYR